MKTITINPKSLHYRLASVYGNLDPHQSTTTSCSYPWHVIGGLFATILIVLLISLFICLIASPIWFLIMGLIYGFIEQITVFQMVGTICWIVVLLSFIAFLYNENILPKLNAVRKAKHIPKHGALYYCWQALKDKTCIKIAVDGVGSESDRIPHTYWINLNNGTKFRVTYPAGESLPENIIRHAQYIFDETLGKDLICEGHTPDSMRIHDHDGNYPLLSWYKVNDIEFEDK